jgi:hypothetical protein
MKQSFLNCFYARSENWKIEKVFISKIIVKHKCYITIVCDLMLPNSLQNKW